MPEGVGTVVWWAASRPCASTFVPFYAALTSVPAAYSSRTAYNAFRAVADSLDKKGTVGGELRYKHYIPLVRSVYGGFETECSNAQASTEATAAAMAPAATVRLPHQLLGPTRRPGAGPGPGAAGADALSATSVGNDGRPLGSSRAAARLRPRRQRAAAGRLPFPRGSAFE